MKRLVCHRRIVSSTLWTQDSGSGLNLSLPDWGVFGQITESASFIYIKETLNCTLDDENYWAGCPGTWWLPIQYVSLPKLGFSHTGGFLRDLGQAGTLNLSFLFYTVG